MMNMALFIISIQNAPMSSAVRALVIEKKLQKLMRLTTASMACSRAVRQVRASVHRARPGRWARWGDDTDTKEGTRSRPRAIDTCTHMH
jgi:hypothetical protein